MLRLSGYATNRADHGESRTMEIEIDCMPATLSTPTGNTEETRWTHVINLGTTKGAYDATIYLPSQDGVHANLFVPPHLVDTSRPAKIDSSFLNQASYRRHYTSAKGSLAEQQKMHDMHSALVVREVGQALNRLWLKARQEALVELKEKISLEDLEEFLGLRNVNKTGAMVELAMLANEIAISVPSDGYMERYS